MVSKWSSSLAEPPVPPIDLDGRSLVGFEFSSFFRVIELSVDYKNKLVTAQEAMGSLHIKN